MKPTQLKFWIVLAFALASGFGAAAQSNGVPGAADYASFSRFITDRNIFDPNRYSHSLPGASTYRPKVSRSAPAFTLVGTMNYEKGMFAFFDGNNSDLRKVLYESDSNSIAGYTAAEITLAGVKLESADKKQTVRLKIGDMMRQEGSEWRLSETGESPAFTSGDNSAAAENSSPAADSAPSSASAPNDILKKLMQQREQELK
jgi:hypothetical protein